MHVTLHNNDIISEDLGMSKKIQVYIFIYACSICIRVTYLLFFLSCHIFLFVLFLYYVFYILWETLPKFIEHTLVTLGVFRSDCNNYEILSVCWKLFCHTRIFLRKLVIFEDVLIIRKCVIIIFFCLLKLIFRSLPDHVYCFDADFEGVLAP